MDKVCGHEADHTEPIVTRGMNAENFIEPQTRVRQMPEPQHSI